MKTKTILLRVWPIILFTLTLAALPVCADETNSEANFSGAEWSLVDLQKIQAAAAEITTQKYPDDDSATVEQRSVRNYRADGTGESQDESFTKVLTEKGKRGNRELAFGFMLPYWTIEISKVEVLKPDGTRLPVDVAANSKESIDDSQMAMNIYDPNMRVLRLSIPQLEIGDMVHTVVRQIIHRSIMPDEYDEGNVFEGTSFIRHVSYEVHAPAAMPLKRMGLRAEVPGTISYAAETNSDMTVYHWDVSNVPRMYDEPDMPPYDEVLQRLFVSTIPSWRDVSKWYWNLSKPHLEMTTPEMKKTVTDLTADAHTDLDKVKALFYYVSKNIRYMGLTPEKDRPGFEPHDVCVTYDKKYGVCRDKAGLLVEMLRLAGFDAYPVLINIGAKRDMEVPQPDFNHAIVCAELKKGEYTLMDPTDENTRDLLPSYDCNRSYLVCKPEGETLLVSPVQPPEEHMLTAKTTGTLDAAGVLDATSEISFTGVNDDAYRNRFAHLKPDDLRRFFEQRLKESMPGARLVSLKVTPENVLDTSVPLHAEIKFAASGLAANGGEKSIVSLPWITGGLGIASRILVGAAGLEKRKYPLNTEESCGVREDISLRLTGGFSGPLALPSFAAIHKDTMDYGVSATIENDSLTCSRELMLKAVEFSPEQYLQLKSTLKDMGYDARKNLIMGLKTKVSETTAQVKEQTPEAVDSNARILESRKTLEVVDAHTAVYRAKYAKRILTYAGKIREAEVKIPYNPACEDVKIISAVVTSKSGAQQKISPGEINAMDEGWNSSAKRYTGGKVLVVNLPGVDIGSTIEVEYEISQHDVPSLSGFELFQFPDALDQKSVRVTAPAGVPIHQFVSGSKGMVKEQRKTSNNGETVDWEATNVKALPSEPSLPPAWTYDAGLQYFIGDPGNYWKSVNDAMGAHSKNSTKAAELARQLTGSSKSKLDAARAIRDFIAKNIRVAGPSFTSLPLRELSDADTTLSDGYGHLADRAILYSAMLTAAGFQPEFVLASDLPPIENITKIAHKVPLPDDFQKPLVKISVDGDDYYFNDTDQYSQLGTTSADANLGLRLADQKIVTIEAAKDCGNKIETDYAISLSDNGHARMKISTRYYGENYNGKHRYFAELPPEERERYFQEAVSRVAQGAQAVGDLTTKFDSYPGLEEFTVDLDDYGVASGKYFYFDLPFKPPFYAAGTGGRSLPLYLADKHESVVRAEIQWPSGFVPTDITPNNGKFAAPGGSQVHITKTSADGKYVVTEHFDAVPAIVTPEDYPKLLDIQSALGRKSEMTFLLERK
jgi:transglutaminase-like putative cysteine protease